MNLEDTIHDTTHRYPGGADSLAPRMGLLVHSLRHKVCVTYPSKHLSPREFALLIAYAGPAPLHALCREVGHMAIPLPKGTSGSAANIAKGLMEAGEFFTTAAKALEDNRVDSAEMRQVRIELMDVYEALGDIMSSLQAMHDRAQMSPMRRGR